MNRSAPMSDEYPFFDILCEMKDQLLSGQNRLLNFVFGATVFLITYYVYAVIIICRMKPKNRKEPQERRYNSLIICEPSPADATNLSTWV